MEIDVTDVGKDGLCINEFNTIRTLYGDGKSISVVKDSDDFQDSSFYASLAGDMNGDGLGSSLIDDQIAYTCKSLDEWMCWDVSVELNKA